VILGGINMGKILKWFGIVLTALVFAIGLLVLGMRFSDGPLEIISGGPFKTGELTIHPDDWSFLTGRDSIEFQTMDPSTSRTVWLGVYDRRLFLVSGYMTTGYGKLWKHWPHYLEEDNRVILRIDGKLYEQRMQRIMDGPEVVPVLNLFNRKYGLGAQASSTEVTEGHTWMYEVVPR